MDQETIQIIARIISVQVPEQEILRIATTINFENFDPSYSLKKIDALINGSADNFKHLYVMIVFGLTRGFGGNKNWKQVLDKTNPAGKAQLDAAKSFFNVKLGRPANRDDITVPRIMQAYALFTFKIYLILVKSGHARKEGYVGRLPQTLRWIGSPAAMDEPSYRAWKDDYVDFSLYCSSIWGNKQERNAAARFAELAFKTTTWPINNRPNRNDHASQTLWDESLNRNDAGDQFTGVGVGGAFFFSQKAPVNAQASGSGEDPPVTNLTDESEKTPDSPTQTNKPPEQSQPSFTPKSRPAYTLQQLPEGYSWKQDAKDGTIYPYNDISGRIQYPPGYNKNNIHTYKAAPKQK